MNLAVFLPGWIGDAVMATPALRALRQRYADATIIGVVKPYVAAVLEGGDWFDRLLLAHDGSWARGVASTSMVLRRAEVETAVLFPNSFRAALTAWLGGCRRRIGYARYGRSALLTEALAPERQPDGRLRVSPLVDAYNLLAVRAGCQSPGYDLELFTTPADERAADRVWDMTGLGERPEVVCLNPGAAFGAAKHWPADHFASLARRLADERGCGVLVLCGPAEREQASHIAESAQHSAVVTLAGLEARDGPRLSLGLTKACVRRADLLITTDSGPRHFAHAFDRPVVTMFGPTHIGWTETYHPRAVHLQKPVECGPCQRRTCPLDHRCMTTLLPEDVFAAAEGLLQGIA